MRPDDASPEAHCAILSASNTETGETQRFHFRAQTLVGLVIRRLPVRRHGSGTCGVLSRVRI
jgi:hypothetical protein